MAWIRRLTAAIQVGTVATAVVVIVAEEMEAAAMAEAVATSRVARHVSILVRPRSDLKNRSSRSFCSVS